MVKQKNTVDVDRLPTMHGDLQPRLVEQVDAGVDRGEVLRYLGYPVGRAPDARLQMTLDAWIEKAAAEDIGLVAFGEVFLSGYPFWVARTDGARWDAPDQKDAYAFYLDAAVRAMDWVYQKIGTPPGADENELRAFLEGRKAESGATALTLLSFLERPDPKTSPIRSCGRGSFATTTR